MRKLLNSLKQKMIFPKIKREVMKFFLNEDAKVTKDAIFKIGVIALLAGSASGVKADTADCSCHQSAVDLSASPKHPGGDHCNDNKVQGYTYAHLNSYDGDIQGVDEISQCYGHDNHKSGACGGGGQFIDDDCPADGLKGDVKDHGNSLKLDNVGTAIVAQHEHSVCEQACSVKNIVWDKGFMCCFEHGWGENEKACHVSSVAGPGKATTLGTEKDTCPVASDWEKTTFFEKFGDRITITKP